MRSAGVIADVARRLREADYRSIARLAERSSSVSFECDGRHGAVAQLRGHIAPESAIGFDILDRGGLQEIGRALALESGCGTPRNSAPAPAG